MDPYHLSRNLTLYCADTREAWKHIPAKSVDAIMTSPPYWSMRDYGTEDQLGQEATPEEFIDDLVKILDRWGKYTLKDEGSMWINIDDTYATKRLGAYKSRSLLLIPERVVIKLSERGWILRNKIAWTRKHCMPSPAKNRLRNKWEYIYHFVKQPKYYYDLDAIRTPYARIDTSGAIGTKIHDMVARGDHGSNPFPHGLTPHELGANPGDVWEIEPVPLPGAHCATYPPAVCERPILATVPEGGTVLDPFFGVGSTAVMAKKLDRHCLGIEISQDYCKFAVDRLQNV